MSDDDMARTFWLIERGQPEGQTPTVWLSGDGASWTTEVGDAWHYTRREAESVIARRFTPPASRGGPTARMTEHSWLPPEAAQWDEDRLTEFLAPKMLDIVEHESKGTVVSLRDQARAGMWARSVARRLLHAGLALPRAEAGTLDDSDRAAEAALLAGWFHRSEEICDHDLEPWPCIISAELLIKDFDVRAREGVHHSLPRGWYKQMWGVAKDAER